MATTISSTAVAVPSFTGLRAPSCTAKAKVATAAPSAKLPRPIKASFKDLGVVVAASAMLVGNAMAREEVVQLGGEFKGEKITTLKKMNGDGFLQQMVVLEVEEDGAGVEVARKSRMEEEGGGGRYSMWVDENLDCTAPQQGPRMDAKEMKRKLLGRLMMPW